MATVFVVGAGPAGLFAAQKIALAGHEVVIFNRDIKPGGLAEYGIYPVKDKMKIGLRKQFDKVLALPNVHYFGHVPVGGSSPVSIDALREFDPAAIVFAVGAQGTKDLALPGMPASGIFSAKDFVYYYNQLPPFATQDFRTGKRVAIIGMGNVMVDIARWLLLDDPKHQTEEVVVVARRGPLEAKFDDKEFAHIHMYLDRKLFAEELARVAPQMAAVGQDVGKVAEETFTCLTKYPDQPSILPRLKFRFLSSPVEVVAGPDGRIARLILSENILKKRGESIACESTNITSQLDVDTLIFAIGDMHDPSLGLPCGPNGYVTNPDTANQRCNYEVFHPAAGEVLKGTYVVGWARKASEGLVGIARHDGESGAAHIIKYLEGVEEARPISANDIALFLKAQAIQAVAKGDLPYLKSAEETEARARGIAWYTFPDDDSMLAAIEREKKRATSDRTQTAVSTD